MLRRTLLAASASPRLRRLITAAPATRAIVDSYVAGETAQDAVRAARALRAAGLLVTLDYLGEDTKDQAQATAVTDEYVHLLGKLGAEGLTHGGAALRTRPDRPGPDQAHGAGRRDAARRDRKSTRLNSSHMPVSRMPSSA